MRRLTPLRFEDPFRWQVKTEGLQQGTLEWRTWEDRPFLCWDQVVGRAAVVSDAVRVPPGRWLTVAWLAQFDGRQYRLSARQQRDLRLASYAAQNLQHHWNDLTDFVGLCLRCFDARGAEIHREDWRTRCLQTEDWQQGWRHLFTPADTDHLTLEFVFESEAETNGCWCVRDVEVWDLEAEEPLPPGMGELVVRLRDEVGKPLLARCQVRSGTEAFAPPFVETYEQDGLWFCSPFSEFRLILPPGDYQVTALHGFERMPERVGVSVQGGCRQVQPIELRRPRLLENWRLPCGEEHVHLYFHRHTHFPHLTPADVFRLARNEGLDFLAFQAELFELLEAEGQPRVTDEEGFLADHSMEVVSDFWGHLATINHRQIVERYPLGPWLAPCNWELEAALEASGAAAIYCHPYEGLQDDEAMLDGVGNGHRLGIARSLPIDLALGRQVGIELLYANDPDSFPQKLRDLYRLWSLGFRVAPTGSSDVYVDQSRLPLGTARTYLFLPMPPEPSGEDLAEAYRRGATLATNGPLLDLRVRDCRPGDQVWLRSGEALAVEVWAFSVWGLEGVEVLCNGVVIQFLQPDADGVARGIFTFVPHVSGWVAARAWGPVAAEVNCRSVGQCTYDDLPCALPAPPWNSHSRVGQFAQTGPVFVRLDESWRPPTSTASSSLDEQPLSPSSAASYFLQWLDRVEQAVEARADLLERTCQRYPDWTPESLRAYIQAHLEEARSFYQEKLAKRG